MQKPTKNDTGVKSIFSCAAWFGTSVEVQGDSFRDNLSDSWVNSDDSSPIVKKRFHIASYKVMGISFQEKKQLGKVPSFG